MNNLPKKLSQVGNGKLADILSKPTNTELPGCPMGSGPRDILGCITHYAATGETLCESGCGYFEIIKEASLILGRQGISRVAEFYLM